MTTWRYWLLLTDPATPPGAYEIPAWIRLLMIPVQVVRVHRHSIGQQIGWRGCATLVWTAFRDGLPLMVVPEKTDG